MKVDNTVNSPNKVAMHILVHAVQRLKEMICERKCIIIQKQMAQGTTCLDKEVMFVQSEKMLDGGN